MTQRIGVTGSRFFGRTHPESDIDLFAQDSPEIRAELLSLGFHEKRLSGKGGPNMTGMYRRVDEETGRSVDVALHASFDRKMMEQRIACTTPVRILLSLCTKKTRDRIWARLQTL